MQRVLSAIERVDNLTDVNTVFKKSGVSKDIAEAVLQQSKFADNLDDIIVKATETSEAVTGMKKATSGLSDGTSKLTKFGNTMKGIGVSLMSFAKVAGVIAAIGGVIAAIDYATHGYTRAVEDATSAAESYAQQKSNVQALTSEYDTLQSKIRELQALQSNGTITMQQEIELANLQNQSAELERQLDIQKQILDAKAQASADAAMAASKEEMSYLEMNQEKYGTFKGIWKAFTGLFDTGINGDYQSDWEEWNKGDTTQIGLVKSNIAELESLNNELNNTREKLAKDANNEKLQKEETDLLEDIANVKTDLASEIETVQGWIEQSLDSNGIPLEGYESFVDSLRDIVTEYQNIGKSVDEVDLNNLNNYFSSTAGKSMKDYLTDIVKNGGSAEDALKAFKKTGMSLETLGVSESGFIRYFKDIETAANKAGEAVKKAGNNLGMDDIGTAFESKNAGADYVTFNDYLKQAKELYDQGLVGTDEFKAVTEMMTYNLDSSADAFKQSYDRIKNFWIEDGNGNLSAQGINNFLTQLQGLGKGYAVWDQTAQKWKIDIDNTAQAAKELNIGVGVFEALLGRIKDYDGVGDFDFVSALQEFDEAKTSLEQLKELYDSMDEGSDKDALKAKLDNWTPMIENAEEDLASLPKEVITQLKFEYDKSQLQQEAEKATNLAKSSGWKDSSYNASAIVSAEDYKSRLAEGFDMSSVAEQSVPIYFDAENALQNLKAQLESGNLDEETTLQVQAEIVNLLNLQNEISEAFQNAHPEITPETDPSVAQQTFDEWIQSAEGQEIVANTTLDYEDVLQKLSELINSDYGDIEIDVDSDISNARSKLDEIENYQFKKKIAELGAEDDATPYLMLWNELTMNPKYSWLNADDKASWVVAIWNALTPEQKEAYLKGEITVTDSATGTIQTVDGALNALPMNPQPKITATENATTVAGIASAALSGIDGKTAHTYIITHRSEDGGDSNLAGTAHKDGTVGGLHPIPKLSSRALAMGTLQDTSWLKPSWKTAKDEVALTGELGREIVVRGNRWWTVGDNGAEFASIPQGSVVFNAKQSDELLSKGFTNSRGTAHLSGTAYLGSANGSFSFGGGASSYNPPYYQPSYTPPSQPAPKPTSKSSSNSSSEKEFNEKIDEIEILLDRMESSLQRLTDSIETYSYDLSKQSEISTQAMNQIRTNLGTLQQAYNRYVQEANSVGLDEGWKQKVQNGSINIETITDETLKKNIDEYQKWFDKSIDVQDKIAEMQQELLDLAVEKLDNIEQYFENRTDYNDNFGYLTPLTLLQESIDKFTKELEKQVGDGVIKEGSNEYFEAMEKLANMQEKLFEATIKKYQDIIDNLSRISDTLDNSIELKEARDEPILESDYKKQIDLNNQSVQEKYNKRQQLIKQQAIYDVGSEKYDELAEEISDIDDDIYGLLTDIEELKDKIWEVRWEPFFEGQEALKDLVDETDTFRDLLDSDAFVGKNGGLTVDGLVNLALLSSAMNEQKQSIKNYSAALEKLQEDYDKGNISAKEFKETSKEFLDEIASGVANVKNYKDEIISLYTEMLEKENDVVQSSIQKHKELLDIKKKNSDYDRNVKKQVKDINTIQAQISALQGVNIFAPLILIAGNSLEPYHQNGKMKYT